MRIAASTIVDPRQMPVIGNGICPDLDPAGGRVSSFARVEGGNAHDRFEPLVVEHLLLRNLLPLSALSKAIRR